MISKRMGALRYGFGLAAAATAMAASAQQPANLPPGAVVQPLPRDDGAELRRHLTALAANPRSLDALIGAGRAALEAGDGEAAMSFFDRAREIAPGNPRVQAGSASALALSGQPQVALGLFAQAVAAGAPEAEIAGDRGLAFDLVGDTGRAQQDYLRSLRHRETPEVRRRLALSLAISGEQAAALRLLDPQLRTNDRSAWRAQAFVLALTGDAGGANRTAQTMMQPGAASSMAPFFARLATLSPAHKAHAVHLGRFPANGGFGNAAFHPPADPGALAWAMGGTVPVRRDQPVQTAAVTPRPNVARPQSRTTTTRPPASRSGSDQGRAAGPAMTQRETSNRVARSARPTTSRRASPADVRREAAGYVARPAERSRPERPDEAIPPRNSALVPVQMAEQGPAETGPVPPPAPVSTRFAANAIPAGSSLTTSPPPPALGPSAQTAGGLAGPPPGFNPPAAQAVPPPASPAPGFSIGSLPGSTTPESSRTGGEALALRTTEVPAATVPGPVEAPAAAPVEAPAARTEGGLADIAALVNTLPVETAAPPARAPASRRNAATTPPPATTRPRSASAQRTQKPAVTHPARTWVQIATGADKAALPREFARLKNLASDELGRRTAYSAPLRATNRLLVGPFANAREAQAFVNDLAKKNIAAFAWTSEEGQEIERLPGR